MQGNTMGFMGQITEPPSPPAPSNPDQVLFGFNSGFSLTFTEATHHTIVVGSTGCGKTTSFILPCLDNLIRQGYAGLCIDIKGNMTEKIRNLALLWHREDDILELGVGPLARPVNLLADLNEDAIHDFFKNITLKNITTSDNMSWYMSGVRIATDLTMLCRYMTRRGGDGFTPTLTVVGELLTDYPLCAEIFERFTQVAWGEKQVNLVRRIQNDPFHPCTWKKSDSAEYKRDYDAQVEWRTHVTRNALSVLRQTPGVEHGFCSATDNGLQMDKWIYDRNRIVILRFGPQSGSAGEDLSRWCLEAFYRSVFACGLDLPEGKYTFMVADEFQDFVDFSRVNRFNDNAFIAKSREFNNIFIAGFQSISALRNRGELKANVESFVNNCNNRVMLYSDDPWTQDVAERHQDVRLTQLDPGEAAVVKFNQTSRRHDYGRESLQQAHDAGQKRQTLAECLKKFSQRGSHLRYSRAEAGRQGSQSGVQSPLRRLREALSAFDRALAAGAPGVGCPAARG